MIGRRTTAEILPLLRLVIPVVAGLAAWTLIGVVDTIMIAPLGTVPLAAASLTASVLIIAHSAIYGFIAPIGIAAARAHGASDFSKIMAAFNSGLWLGIVSGIGTAILMAAALFLLPYIGQPPDVLIVLPAYWMAMSATLLPTTLLMVVGQVLNAADRPWMAASFAFVGVALNIPLNYVLIWGVGSWPGFGLVGAGLASLLSEALALAGAIVWLRTAGYWPRVSASMRETLRLGFDGVPLSIGYLGEGAAYALVSLMLGWFGAIALAANQIVQSVGAVLYMLPLGMAAAVAIRVGQALGAEHYDRLRPAAGAAVLVVTVWMVFVTLGLILFGEIVSRALSVDPPVVHLATAMFIVVALIQVADGIQATALGALRGLSDFVWPTAFTLVCYWIFALPLAYILGFVFDFGPLGVWVGYGLGIVVAAFALPVRFLRLTRLPPAAL